LEEWGGKGKGRGKSVTGEGNKRREGEREKVGKDERRESERSWMEFTF